MALRFGESLELEARLMALMRSIPRRRWAELLELLKPGGSQAAALKAGLRNTVCMSLVHGICRANKGPLK